MCVYLKGEFWSFYIPTNPSQSFLPGSFLLISLTNLLLQTARISHTVDLYLCSLCFIFPSHLSFLCSCFFPPLPPSPSSPSPTNLSLSVCFCKPLCTSNCCSNFTNTREGRKVLKGEKTKTKTKKLKHLYLWGGFSQLLPELQNASVSLNAGAQSN